MTQNLVYILSPSFSGSTLLTALLARHPEIATVGELKATSMGNIDEYMCSCGVLLNNCEFWMQLQDRLAKSNSPLDLNDFGTHFSKRRNFSEKIVGADVRGPAFELCRSMASALFPGVRASRRNILQRNEILISHLLNLESARIFMDGSKDPIRLKYFEEFGQRPVLTIRIDRDGRAVANSIAKHNALPYAQAVRTWRKAMREVIRQWDRIPSHRRLRITYEDFCSDPHAITQACWAFMGLDTPSSERSQVHILGNNMRIANLSEIRLDQKWRTELSQEDLAVFEHCSDRLNRQLGYEDN